MREDLSDEELAICVLQYRKAWKKGGQSHAVDRSAFFKGALRGGLKSRGEGSVQRRMCNLSAIMELHGKPHVICLWGAIALLGVFLGGAAEALQLPRQDGGQQITAIIAPPKFAPPAAQDCVLHVWPGSDAHSSYSGWFHGGAVDGDKRGIRGYPPMHADVLSTAKQRALLAKIDWADLRGMPGLKVVIHDAPAPPDDDFSRSAPLLAGQVGCYDELLVHSVLVERATFSSTSVRVMMIAKRWRAPDWRPATYGAMSVDRVDLGSGDANATQSTLDAGFVSAIHKFIRDEHFLRR